MDENLISGQPQATNKSQPPNWDVAESATSSRGLGHEDTVSLHNEESSGEQLQQVSVPTRLGDYEILGEIARGGMGIVYRARHLRLGRLAAVKLIKTGDLADDDEVRRFHAEAAAAAQLDHPNIVQVYEVGLYRGQSYMALALVDGPSLWSRVKERPLQPADAARLMQMVAHAVQYAHDRQIVHRDIKPQNILVTADGQPKLTDFGLAKRQAADSSLTATGQAIGTPSFMPPEQAAGLRDQIGPTSDVYSLGATLYCLLSGRPPFQAASAVQTLQQVLELEPVPLRALNPALPRDLETVCLKCLQKPPDLRYGTARELADDLGRFLAGEPIVARRLGRCERLVRWCRRRPLAAALVAALLAIAIMATGTIVIGRQAYHTKLENKRVQELASWQLQFNNHLEVPNLKADYLATAMQLVSEISELDRAQGIEARERFERRYADHLRETIYQPRLTDEDVEVLTRAIENFQSINASSSQQLSSELSQSLRRWTALFRLAAPFSNLKDVFSSPALSVSDGQLVSTVPVSSGDGLAFYNTDQVSSGDIEFDAVFGPEWRKSDCLALAIDAPRSEGEKWDGYQFVLRAVLPPESSNDPAARASLRFENASSMLLEITKQQIPLRRVTVDAALLNLNAPIHLQAIRTNGHLSFRVNTLAPLEVDDLFWSASSSPGVLALGDMRGSQLSHIDLEELSARTRQSTARAIPLIAGDDFYVRNEFREALDQYRLQARTAKQVTERNEALFKEAMCLLALQREEEAIELFNEELVTGEQPWSVRAAFQLWLIYLRAGKVSQADEVMAHLSSTHQFEDLASIVPLNTLNEIMDIIVERSNSSRAGSGKLIANIERLIDSLVLLGASETRLYAARVDLLTAYELQDDERRVYEISKLLLASPSFDDVPDPHGVTTDFCRMALAFGEAEEAVRTIDGLVFHKGTSELNLPRVSLLNNRAMLHAGTEQWEKARDDLQLLLSQGERVRECSKEVRDVYDVAFVQGSLLLGLVYDKMGDASSAQKAWREGYEYSRQHDFPDFNAWESGALGSLSGELTEQDIERMANKLTEGLPVVVTAALRNRVLPISLLTNVTRHVWQRPRGRVALEQSCWGSKLARNSVLQSIEAMLHEIARELVLGENNLANDLSPEESHVLDQVVTDLVQAYRNGEIDETHAMQAIMMYHGNVGLLGFGSLSGRLPTHLRGPGAYVFACHLFHQNKLSGAKALADAAAKDGTPGSPLEVLVERLRQQIGNN